MYIEERLITNQRINVAVSGTNVYLGKGALVQVLCKPSNHTYTLRRGDQIQLPNGQSYTSIDITNLGPDGDISVVCVEGQFFPTMDGSKINISADLEAENMAVTFQGRQPVALPSNQKVEAKVTNFPAVMDVQVNNMPAPVEVQKVHVVETSTPNLRYVAHNTMTTTGTISGNTKRKELILKAADSNEGTIWLGGYENRGYGLRPAEGFILSNGAEVEVLIPANCKLFVSEVTA